MAISKRTRFEVLRRDGHRCFYCGATSAQAKLTVDHVMPKALGGTDNVDNLITACEPCNSGKSSASPDASTVAAVSETLLALKRSGALAVDAMLDNAAEARELATYARSSWLNFTMPDGSTLPHGDFASPMLRLAGLHRSTELADEAIRITMKRHGVPADDRFAYFCGVVKNMASEYAATRDGLSASVRKIVESRLVVRTAEDDVAVRFNAARVGAMEIIAEALSALSESLSIDAWYDVAYQLLFERQPLERVFAVPTYARGRFWIGTAYDGSQLYVVESGSPCAVAETPEVSVDDDDEAYPIELQARYPFNRLTPEGAVARDEVRTLLHEIREMAFEENQRASEAEWARQAEGGAGEAEEMF